MNKRTVVAFVSMIVLAGVLGYTYPHENKPPKFAGEVWPSCHWEGSDGANDWRVLFQIDDLPHQTVFWRQWVAQGLSEKAAESLCDAYVKIPEIMNGDKENDLGGAQGETK